MSENEAASCCPMCLDSLFGVAAEQDHHEDDSTGNGAETQAVVVSMAPCGHRVHQACFQLWMEARTGEWSCILQPIPCLQCTCPVQRVRVVAKEGDEIQNDDAGEQQDERQKPSLEWLVGQNIWPASRFVATLVAIVIAMMALLAICREDSVFRRYRWLRLVFRIIAHSGIQVCAWSAGLLFQVIVDTTVSSEHPNDSRSRLRDYQENVAARTARIIRGKGCRLALAIKSRDFDAVMMVLLECVVSNVVALFGGLCVVVPLLLGPALIYLLVRWYKG